MTTFLLLTLLAADPSTVAVTYEGQLLQLERGQPAAIVKEFDARTLLEARVDGTWQATTLVSESAAALPWPERLTRQESRSAKSVPAAIGYRHDERMYVVTGMFPLLPSPEPLREGLTWKAGEATYEVAGTQAVGEVECWLVHSVTGPARRHQILVRQDQPVVEVLKQTVFMGQGDRFEMVVTRKETTPLSPEAATTELAALQLLQDLQSTLQRDEHDRAALLTDEQVRTATEQLAAVTKAATNTAYAQYVSQIDRELNDRAQRADKLAELGQKFVGQMAPPFKLTQLDGQELLAENYAHKVVVLHFWGYQDQPLEQPYGQIGYLDFLATRYQDRPLVVYGVAVDAQFASPMTRDAAVRSVRRLTTFMKTGYEVTLDTRSVLNQFGNPTRLGAELPLWVVLDRSGKIVHYHSGYYTIDSTRGLKELDELVEQLLQVKE